MKLREKLITAVLIFTAACAVENVQPEIENEYPEDYPAQNEVMGTIADFFPFKENTALILEYEREPQKLEIFTAFVNENRIQRHLRFEGGVISEATEVLEKDNGILRQIAFFNYFVFEDITDIEPQIDIIILKEPLVVGTAWENPDNTVTITACNVDIITPAGDFRTLEITTVDNNNNVTVAYYAIGYGLIVYRDREIMQLTAIREGYFTVRRPLFFPDDMLMDLDTRVHDFLIHTDRSSVELFNEALPLAIEDLNHTRVNSIEINREASLITVDFDPGILNINMGTSYEYLILRSLASTFGHFYNVSYFRITLNGENYVSGHFWFDDDETIIVRYP